MEHIRKPGEEWGGQSSSKFLPSKMHVKPIETREMPHPLFSTLGRKHIPAEQERRSCQAEWKPSRVVAKENSHWIDKHTSNIITKFTIVKPKSERINTIDNMSLKLKEKKLLNSKVEQLQEEKIVKELGRFYRTYLI